MFQNPQPRNNQTVRYPPVGECIYCGATECKLRDEHIIPKSLGGSLILPNASCKSCEKITCRFEGTVARSLFGNFRMRHNLPTRRPKERPSHIEVSRLDDNSADGRFSVPTNEFPAPAFMYKCTKAGILEGFMPDVDLSSSWKIVGIVSDDDLKSFAKKHGENTIYSFRYVPQQFAQTIAKIGHAYAISHFGVGTFRPLAVDLILGKSKNLSYVVGGSFEIMPAVPDAGHLLELEVRTNFRKALVVAGVRLFASASTPHYHVVVGQVDDEKATQSLIKMCQQPAS